MATTQTRVGVPWDGRTAYERWVEDDLKLDLHRGYSASGLKTVAVRPWAERGISAAFYDITGAESLAGMYVGEIAPGASSKPARPTANRGSPRPSPRSHRTAVRRLRAHCSTRKRTW